MNFFGRMKGKKAKEQREAAKELEQSIHMVKAPAVLQQEPSLTLPKIKVKVSQQQSEENHAMEEWFHYWAILLRLYFCVWMVLELQDRNGRNWNSVIGVYKSPWSCFLFIVDDEIATDFFCLWNIGKLWFEHEL